MEEKYIYSFKQGNKEMKQLLGGKGANLAEMVKMGLPVPDGFTITTEACNRFYDNDQSIWDGLDQEIRQHIKELENNTGKAFSSVDNPLLVSVRSGSPFSMPGMMDTILNLGLNETTVKILAKVSNNDHFAYDSYRRFIQMFADVVMEIPKENFEELLEAMKLSRGVLIDSDLSGDDFKELVKQYLELYDSIKQEPFPQDPHEQLRLAIIAVFKSWQNPRAVIYRRLNQIDSHFGTAVNIQMMVYGNKGDDSGTGVAFSRNPATGENKLFGEYLMNAQGEDVVAGIRTPHPMIELKESMPTIYNEFETITKILERNYHDMQDIEFTIETGKLYILQTRNGKRTAPAAIQIAVDLVNEGLISKTDAILRIDPLQLEQLLHPRFDEKELIKATHLASGLAASPGAASGTIYFNADDVVKAHAKGEACILVRQETSPEDIEGMDKAMGILTSRGGMTSHAAVVARGMGKCCIAGCSEIHVNEAKKILRIGNLELTEGDAISLNGGTGKIYLGHIAKVDANLSGNFQTFMTWVDAHRKLEVRANADSPKDAKQALTFGAEGIGLCRTEHMFFEEQRIFSMRKMILSDTLEKRKEALSELLPIQREDFKAMFEVMGPLPMTIRLLDPPLHEFLPTKDDDIKELAQAMNISLDVIHERLESLVEVNPMLGHRGCRLAVTYPEIYQMQVRAIIESAIDQSFVPEIMIPLVSHVAELKLVKESLIQEIETVFKEQGKHIDYHIGTMLEVPRAAITADEIAPEAAFFSFGTNDLSQMTFGFSRDDAGKFLPEYLDNGILKTDPFESIDQDGVGKLMKLAVKLAREAKPDIKLGICGEHGGEPNSVKFCYGLGLDYVSCSPYRIPVAKLAAAQISITETTI